MVQSHCKAMYIWNFLEYFMSLMMLDRVSACKNLFILLNKYNF